jgi:hypothetical protein
VTDLNPRIPQWVQHTFGQTRNTLIAGIVRKKHHIDIAVRRDEPAPVAADSDERDASKRLVAQLRCMRRASQTAEQTVEHLRITRRYVEPALTAADCLFECRGVRHEVIAAGLH